MSIVEFPQRSFPASGAWSADELQQLIALFRADGETSYATGTTEHGDPQFYLLGPAPAHECVLCVSRLAQTYVLEDGEGRLIGETPSLDGFAVEAARAAVRGSRSLGRAARAGVVHHPSHDRGEGRADLRGVAGIARALRAAGRGVRVTARLAAGSEPAAAAKSDSEHHATHRRSHHRTSAPGGPAAVLRRWPAQPPGCAPAWWMQSAYCVRHDATSSVRAWQPQRRFRRGRPFRARTPPDRRARSASAGRRRSWPRAHWCRASTWCAG